MDESDQSFESASVLSWGALEVNLIRVNVIDVERTWPLIEQMIVPLELSTSPPKDLADIDLTRKDAVNRRTPVSTTRKRGLSNSGSSPEGDRASRQSPDIRKRNTPKKYREEPSRNVYNDASAEASGRLTLTDHVSPPGPNAPSERFAFALPFPPLSTVTDKRIRCTHTKLGDFSYKCYFVDQNQPVFQYLKLLREKDRAVEVEVSDALTEVNMKILVWQAAMTKNILMAFFYFEDRAATACHERGLGPLKKMFADVIDVGFMWNRTLPAIAMFWTFYCQTVLDFFDPEGVYKCDPLGSLAHPSRGNICMESDLRKHKREVESLSGSEGATGKIMTTVPLGEAEPSNGKKETVRCKNASGERHGRSKRVKLQVDKEMRKGDTLGPKPFSVFLGNTSLGSRDERTGSSTSSSTNDSLVAEAKCGNLLVHNIVHRNNKSNFVSFTDFNSYQDNRRVLTWMYVFSNTPYHSRVHYLNDIPPNGIVPLKIVTNKAVEDAGILSPKVVGNGRRGHNFAVGASTKKGGQPPEAPGKAAKNVGGSIGCRATNGVGKGVNVCAGVPINRRPCRRAKIATRLIPDHVMKVNEPRMDTVTPGDLNKTEYAIVVCASNVKHVRPFVTACRGIILEDILVEDASAVGRLEKNGNFDRSAKTLTLFHNAIAAELLKGFQPIIATGNESIADLLNARLKIAVEELSCESLDGSFDATFFYEKQSELDLKLAAYLDMYFGVRGTSVYVLSRGTVLEPKVKTLNEILKMVRDPEESVFVLPGTAFFSVEQLSYVSSALLYLRTHPAD